LCASENSNRFVKLQYIRDEDYGGAMVWNIDLDDFDQTCSSSPRPYPLMRLMKEVLGGYNPPTAAPTTQGPTTAAPPTDPPGTTDEPITTKATTQAPGG